MKKKPRRHVLGVGYPCYMDPRGLKYTAICLTQDPNLKGQRVALKTRLGGWRKCRLILEPR